MTDKDGKRPATSLLSETLNTVIRERLKQCRLALSASQVEMDERLSLGRRSWQRYEGGDNVPGSQVIAGLVRLGFNANWVLTGEGEMLIESQRPLTGAERALLQEFDDYRGRTAAGKPMATAMLEFTEEYNIFGSLVSRVEGIEKVTVEMLASLRRKAVAERVPGHMVVIEQRLVGVSLAVAIVERLVKEEGYVPSTGWHGTMTAMLVAGELSEEGARSIIRWLKASSGTI